MKSRGLAFVLSLLLSAMLLVFGQTALPEIGKDREAMGPASDMQMSRLLSELPLAFTENVGQFDERVSFRAHTAGISIWFTGDGVCYQFMRPLHEEEPADNSSVFQVIRLFGNAHRRTEQMIIKASFVGCLASPEIRGEQALPHKSNYFLGNDPSRWRTDVPNFGAVRYLDIYSGIDLKYYGNGEMLEYDFIVDPGADINQIQIAYEGVEAVSVNESGELVLDTKWGEVIEQAPVVYQLREGVRWPVQSRYSLKGDRSFGFELSDAYDPALPVVIDPVLDYCTYLGGGDTEYTWGKNQIDDNGNLYVAGFTWSTDFPTQNAYQDALVSWHLFDAVVSKINPSATALVYSTYLGGEMDDQALSLDIDENGLAYVVGVTLSEEFPCEEPYQDESAGESDAFVTCLSAAGNSLVFSSYFGGSDHDAATCIAHDRIGSIYFTGITRSEDFPTEAAYQSSLADSSDAFVVIMSDDGSDIEYGTYFGGSDHDEGWGIAVADDDRVAIVGRTVSTDFPTYNALQSSHGGDSLDAFVAGFAEDCDSLEFSTYLGGSGNDVAYEVAFDDSGDIHLSGGSDSEDFPVSYNAFQDENAGYADAIACKLSGSGDDLMFSTYLGGSYNDAGYGVTTDRYSNTYVIGSTWSTDFPVENSLYSHGGYDDAFVTKLNRAGSGLVYSTFIGSDGNPPVVSDRGFGISVDTDGAAFATGIACGPDLPVTSGVFQEDLEGWWDLFALKIDDDLIEYECGDIDGDSDIDMDDVYCLLYAVMQYMPLPIPYWVGDVDCSGLIDIDDVVYLSSYLSSSGPAPCAGC